jgi:sulfide:quinone oxidoreductase
MAGEAPVQKKRVVVLGGGFAGVQTAIGLQKQGTFAVTLVSDRDYFYLYPTSIWIPVRKTPFARSQVSLEEISKAHGFSFVIDTVRSIQIASGKVACEANEFSYDYLVVAMGAEKVSLPGIEHTLSLSGKPELSLAIRDRIDALVAAGQGSIAVGFGGNPKDQSAVRGGPAFELMFNIHTLLKKKGIREKFTLTFFAPMEKPGERMGGTARKMVDRMLARLDIGKRFGKKFRSFDPRGVVFEDQSRLDADLVLYIPGGAGHSALKASDLPLNEAGFIRIDDHGLVEGTRNVYAVGDIAALEGPAWRAKQGHVAEVMARNAVFNIVMNEQAKTDRRGHREHLSIICLLDTGNGAALVYRDNVRDFVIPLPVIGHWMKRGWGAYARWTKLGKIPQLPGL